MKKKAVRWCAAAGVLALAAGGIAYRNASAQPAGTPVRTYVAGTGSIDEELSASGFVRSEVSRSYFAPAEVVVKNLQVETGDAVKQGQQLLEYDTEEAEYKEKTASLQASSSGSGYAGSLYESSEQERKYIDAQNNLMTVEPMIFSQKQYIEECESWLEDDVSRRKVDLYHEQYQLQKELNSLNEEQALAGQEGRKISEGVLESVEHVQNAMEKVDLELKLLDEDGTLTQVERAIVQEKNKLSDLEEFRDRQEAIRDSAEPQVLNGYEKGRLRADNALVQMQLEEARKELAEAQGGVTADFDGIVTELNVQDGSQAAPETAILKLESSSQVCVAFSVSKYDLGKLAEGQDVTVNISDRLYDGKVSKIDRMATTGSSGVPMVGAKVHIQDPDDRICLGVEAKLTIHTASVQDAVLLPIEAIGTDREGDFCYVIENGTAVRRRLETGIASDSQMEIKSGLAAGETVILDIASVTEGMPVTALEEETPEGETPEEETPEEETPEDGTPEEETPEGA